MTGFVRGGLALGLALALAGCGEQGGAAKPAPADDSSEIKRRSVESLPAVGSYLPPLDEGRLEVAPPEGWGQLPYGMTYILGFNKGTLSELPRITIAVEDAPDPSLGDLTEENAADHAAALEQHLLDNRRRTAEPPKPIILGETVFARHVRLARYGAEKKPTVIQSLQTVRDGRLYSVDLVCEVKGPKADKYEKSLTEWRDFGYAVAANLRFTGSAAGPASTPVETPPVIEESNPAEGKPAEENPKS